MSAKQKIQHVHAQKVSEILQKKSIPEAGRDKWGNPFIKPEFISRLPVTVKADYEKKGCHRIVWKLYKQ